MRADLSALNASEATDLADRSSARISPTRERPVASRYPYAHPDSSGIKRRLWPPPCSTGS